MEPVKIDELGTSESISAKETGLVLFYVGLGFDLNSILHNGKQS